MLEGSGLKLLGEADLDHERVGPVSRDIARHVESSVHYCVESSYTQSTMISGRKPGFFYRLNDAWPRPRAWRRAPAKLRPVTMVAAASCMERFLIW
jgi:hypothetical protein